MNGQSTPVAAASGLEGVVAAQTRLSDVDGERGRLVIAGYDVEHLAAHASFERAVGLLWDGELRERALGAGRAAAFERLGRVGDALDAADGMDALRCAAGHLATTTREELVGAVAVFAAAWARAQQGQPPIPPNASAPHAADYLRMASGCEPSPTAVRALDAYLVTVCDHGMNASTFAARVVASTGSDDVSAITAALGALKGPLHGGAPGPVLDMLDQIGEPGRAEAWLAAQLQAGKRIMGMGHRVYRTRDPRAEVLEQALRRAGLSTPRLALARAVETAAEGVLRSRHPDRPLRANVEFYTAVLLDAVGLPRQLFTPTFAVSRVAGWLAHAAEQRASGRLIRPASMYVGPAPAPKQLSDSPVR
jgi:citrate synthase